MGLFQSKQQTKKKTPADEVTIVVHEVFNEAYREELRTIGRDSFKQIISDNTASFKKDLDSAIADVSTELKSHMTKQLDVTIAHVSSELTKRLNDRLAESDRVTADAQDQAVQSLNRNAQVLHEKYQQLNSTLQQTVASQEAMMIGVFEENKSQMTTTQHSQDVVLQSLKESAQTAQDQTKLLNAALQKSINDQEAAMKMVLEENQARVTATQTAQDAALKTLDSSAKALEEQHQQLSQLLQKTVTDQEAMLVNVFQDNMAQIIEHYLLGALGDQFDMKAQLPSIIKQMDANKQAMMDDMKL
jgi:hypothetical protein